ncbi:hypothetical protein CYY_001513 [Polysphondylium violaceum]|uniref:Uncharacterized protein n=1 Tax=Polysphondylium violaceum TaxID=133409 RepID=A0A8J4V7V4_9MYCE|nr:hypothetical protein CYY_001513 [Polysphondylium violaceum]
MNTIATPTVQQLVQAYRQIIRKANKELKYTNFEYFRFRVKSSFKEPVETDYIKTRKYQDALYLIDNNLGNVL